MHLPSSFFQDELRQDFFIPTMMKRWWASQMEVLADVDRICTKHGISYFADWGTLLGTWRHNGFIPWDDDLDIGMLRPEYERFLQVAPQELADWYTIHTFADEGVDFDNNVVRIDTGMCQNRGKAYLEKFHGCPYVTGIDIFVYDYLAPTPEEDAGQQEEFRSLQIMAEKIDAMDRTTKRDVQRTLEKKYGYTFSGGKSLKSQCYQLADQVAARYMSGTEAAGIYARIRQRERFGRDYRIPVAVLTDLVRVPFETMTISVPRDMEAMLSRKYSAFETPVRRQGAHGYPAYALQDALWEKEGFSRYFLYANAKKIQKDGRPGAIRNTLVGLLPMLVEVQAGLATLLEENKEEALFLLEDIQDAVIAIGTNIETAYGEGHPTVTALEHYCEAIYEVHEGIMPSLNGLERALDAVEHSAKTEILDKKEVIFCPLQAAHWDALADLYEKAMAEEDTQVYVVPLPYRSVQADGSLSEEIYIDGIGAAGQLAQTQTPEETEGQLLDTLADSDTVTLVDTFPADISITDYGTFPWELHSLDVVYITDPYDGYGLATSVDPTFTSDRLATMADTLIYVPGVVPQQVGPADKLSRRSLQAITNTPGVAHADTVLVSGQGLKEVFLDNLTAWAGEDTRAIWEEKMCQR